METGRCLNCMGITDALVCPHCGGTEVHNEPHQLPAGTVLRDQYLIGRALGQGGFGITYLGWDIALGRTVAVKEFYPNTLVNRDASADPSVKVNTVGMEPHYAASKERFLREARALAKLADIPQIVGIHACFQDNNTAYIVMEFVRGVDLATYVRRRGGKLGVEETLRILDPVIRALSTVHKAGLVHRDISPDNIMLHPTGGAKLLDFGAVRAIENPNADQDLARSTEAILKPGFAPMEQYRTRGNVGPWSDEYALCGTIYYCLTGRVPPDAVSRSMGEEDVDWDAIPGLAPHQRAALKKGMSFLAKDRYPNMEELYDALITGPDSSVRQKITVSRKAEAPVQVRTPKMDRQEKPGISRKKNELPDEIWKILRCAMATVFLANFRNVYYVFASPSVAMIYEATADLLLLVPLLLLFVSAVMFVSGFGGAKRRGIVIPSVSAVVVGVLSFGYMLLGFLYWNGSILHSVYLPADIMWYLPISAAMMIPYGGLAFVFGIRGLRMRKSSQECKDSMFRISVVSVLIAMAFTEFVSVPGRVGLLIAIPVSLCVLLTAFLTIRAIKNRRK